MKERVDRLDRVCMNCIRYSTSKINESDFNCSISYFMDMPKSIADNFWCHGEHFIEADIEQIEERLNDIKKYKESETE